MGKGIIEVFKRISSESRLTFLSSLFISLAIHLYKFMNTLPNHDALFNFYSDQNVLGSGRWALSPACTISSYYDLPWVIGLLSCIFIGLTAVVIVKLFKLTNPVLIILCSLLLASAPATTETFFFEYTADGYMIAMLLAALSVWFSRIGENRLSRIILAGCCLCVSCGIYQAYVSFALLLTICRLIDLLLINYVKKRECLKWLIRQAFMYIISLAVYYLIWQLAMKLTGTRPNDYQGISTLGNISPIIVLRGAVNAIRTSLLYFLQWNVLKHGFSLYSILSCIFLIAFAVGIAAAVIKSHTYERKWAILLIILCLAAMGPCAAMWKLVSEDVGYRPMMLQGLTITFMLCGIIYERWLRIEAKNAVGLLLFIICLNDALIANICYYNLDKCYERSYAEGLEMMLEIHELQNEYDIKRIAIIGKRIDEVQFENISPETGRMTATGRLHILNGGIEKSLLFDNYRTYSFLKGIFGLELVQSDEAERNELAERSEVQEMETWDESHSLIVIDDTVIIKLG